MMVISVLPSVGHYCLWLYLLVFVVQGQSHIGTEWPEKGLLFAVIKTRSHGL